MNRKKAIDKGISFVEQSILDGIIRDALNDSNVKIQYGRDFFNNELFCYISVKRKKQGA